MCKDQVNDKSIAKMNELTHLQNNIEEIRQERDSSQREESVTKEIDEESDKQGNVQKLVKSILAYMGLGWTSEDEPNLLTQEVVERQGNFKLAQVLDNNY